MTYEDPREHEHDRDRQQPEPLAREVDEDRWDSRDDGDYRYTDWASI